jgi:hypothetical protein
VRLFCVYIEALRLADRLSKESYRLCIRSRNWKSGQFPSKDCRAIIIIIIDVAIVCLKQWLPVFLTWFSPFLIFTKHLCHPTIFHWNKFDFLHSCFIILFMIQRTLNYFPIYTVRIEKIENYE